MIAHALFAAVVWLTPVGAEAQFSGLDLGPGFYVTVTVAGVAGLQTVVLTIADVVSFAGDTPFEDGWAIYELVSATLTIVMAGVKGLSFLFASIPASALAAFNITHAVWSLTNRDRDGPVTSAFAAPQQDGFVVGVSGAF